MSLSQVKLSEADALAMIQAAHPGYVTPTQMIDKFNVSKSVTNRMMQRLETKGLIERVYNKSGHLRAFYPARCSCSLPGGSVMKEFISTLLRGKVTVSMNRYLRFGYDRCLFGRWDYYVLHCGPFSLMVTA